MENNMITMKFVTIKEVEVKDGDLLLHNGLIKNDYFILANTGVGYSLISLKNGNRWNDPCSIEELKNKVEKDGGFSYFGNFSFGEEEEVQQID